MVVPLNVSASGTLTGSCPAPELPANASVPAHHAGTYDWDPKLQGVVLGAFFYPYVLLQIPQGRLAETIGAKWIIAFSLLGSAVVNLATPLVASSVTMLIVTRILLGAFQSGIFPAGFAVLRQWFPEQERSVAFAFTEVGLASGMVIGSALAGYLTEHGFAGGWPSAFYVCGIMALVNFVLWTLFAHSTPRESPFVKEAELMYITEGSALVDTDRQAQEKPSVPWKGIFTSLPVWSLIMGRFTVTFSTSIFMAKLPAYINDVLQIGTTMNGAINSAMWLTSAAGGLMSGYLSERLIQMGWLRRTTSRKVFQCTANLLGAALMCFIPSINCDVVVFISLLVIANFILGFISGGTVPLPSEMSHHFPATVYACMNTINQTAGFITPYFVGMILQSNLSDNIRVLWAYIFYISAAVTAFGGIFFFIFAKAEPQPWDMVKKDGRQYGTYVEDAGRDE
ncbi:Sialin [Halotydeus destructor]|nr:Sialin [Halotydeus destructor]